MSDGENAGPAGAGNGGTHHLGDSVSHLNDARRNSWASHAPAWALVLAVVGATCVNFGVPLLYMHLQGGFDATPTWFLGVTLPSAFGVVLAVVGLVVLPLTDKRRGAIQVIGPLCGNGWCIPLLVLSPGGPLLDFCILTCGIVFQAYSGELAQFACYEHAAHWVRAARVFIIALAQADLASDMATGFHLVLQADKLELGIPILVGAFVFDGFALDKSIKVMVKDSALAGRVFLGACLTEIPIIVITLYVVATVSSDHQALVTFGISASLSIISLCSKAVTYVRKRTSGQRLIQASNHILTPEEFDVLVDEFTPFRCAERKGSSASRKSVARASFYRKMSFSDGHGVVPFEGTSEPSNLSAANDTS